MPEISLCLSSNRPDNMRELFRNTVDTVTKPENVEFVINIDREDREMEETLIDLQTTPNAPQIKYIITDPAAYSSLPPYFLLGPKYNQLVFASSLDSYFINIINDRIRFGLKGWDEKIVLTKRHFKDDIFYIRTTPGRKEKRGINRIANIGEPDCHPFYTKKLWSLLEGIGDYHSHDGWFEPILQRLCCRYEWERTHVLIPNIWKDYTAHTSRDRDSEVGKLIREHGERLFEETYENSSWDRIAYNIAKELGLSKANEYTPNTPWIKQKE